MLASLNIRRQPYTYAMFRNFCLNLTDDETVSLKSLFKKTCNGACNCIVSLKGRVGCLFNALLLINVFFL